MLVRREGMEREEYLWFNRYQNRVKKGAFLRRVPVRSCCRERGKWNQIRAKGVLCLHGEISREGGMDLFPS